MLNTLLISENFPPRVGGSGRWFWEEYRRLPRERYVIAAGEHERQHDFDLTHDLRLYRLPLTLSQWGLRSWPGLRGYGKALWPLRRLIKDERIGRLHCGRCLPEGLMARIFKLWKGLPYVCYVHGEEMNYAASSRELSWLMRQVLGSAELIVANSYNTERILFEDWSRPAHQVRVLHPGVDANRYIPAVRDSAARAALGWGKRPVVLTVGRLQKRKGHDRMIAALTTVRKAVPNVLYAIAGDGEERGYLEELVQRDGLTDHVQFLGEIEDERLLQCYQQCDLFVLANRQVGQDIEGFGIVLLEAQACGKPVIAGASGGTAETMRAPETGLVIPCEEPHKLAAAVLELLQDPERRARMGAAGREWIVERFDWSVLSSQVEQIFEQGAPRVQPALIG